MENKPRGRPTRSEIRQNIIEILVYSGPSYGYDIYKHYVGMFPRVTMRSIYYHLNKGLSLKEFEVSEIKRVKGNYSWGPDAEKIFYKLGSKAEPNNLDRVKEYFKELKKVKKKK